MKLSMENKFPNHILFPEIPKCFFEITGIQNSVYRSVCFELVSVGAAQEYRTLLSIYVSQIFSD